MKNKKIIIFLTLMLVLCLPTLVKADCAGSGGYKDYKVKVSNKKGATTYECEDKTCKASNFVIPYSTELYVSHDYAKVSDDYILEVSYNEKNYYVKSSDLQNINEDLNNDFKLVDTNYYTYIDTEVRSGPGILYNVIGTIQKDTNIKIASEFINDFESIGKGDGIASNFSSWIYISDGKVSGYIYYETCYGAYNNIIGTKVEKNDYYYLGPTNEELGLQYGDLVNVKYFVKRIKGYGDFIIEINGKNECIDGNYIGIKCDYKLIALDLKEFNVIDVESGEQLKISDYIKENVEYQVNYMSVASTYERVYYLVINNKKIKLVPPYIYEGDFAQPFIIVDDKDSYKFSKSSQYGFYREDKNKNIFEEDIELEAYEVIYGLSYDSNTEQYNLYYNEDYGFIYSIEDSEGTESEEIKDRQDDEVVSIDGLTSEQYITLCLIGSILLALIVVVVIILLNRKKNINKTNDLVNKNDKENN